jgi:CBS domain-containing protein
MAGRPPAAMLACMPTSAPNLVSALVADVMRGPVITCAPETPLTTVAQMMSDDHVHAVVVTGIEGTAWGVVTALDLATAAAEAGDVARDVAATEPVVVEADTPLSEAARIMVEHQVNHLLVTGADGSPVGVVSTTDVARSLASSVPS